MSERITEAELAGWNADALLLEDRHDPAHSHRVTTLVGEVRRLRDLIAALPDEKALDVRYRFRGLMALLAEARAIREEQG